MLAILRLSFCAMISSCGRRAMVPSSFIISQRTPAGYKPARRARSTVASVWPALTSTPPSRARIGKMWPGRPRSPGLVAGSIIVFIVSARSWAEIPVVTPRILASTETVKAVPCIAVFSPTIIGMFNSFRRFSVIGMQIRPRAFFAMKLIPSAVIFSAAMIRSPSFSRPSSSTRMMNLPAFTSLIISGMLDNVIIYSRYEHSSDC